MSLSPTHTACTDITVLVVEDHDDSRDFLVHALRHLGAHVVAVGGAAKALAYLKTVKPHVVVSDLSMPDKDGFEFLQEVRASPYLRDVPAVAVTGHRGLEGRAERAGFQRFMRKPIDALELCRVIGALVAAGGQREAT